MKKVIEFSGKVKSVNITTSGIEVETEDYKDGDYVFGHFPFNKDGNGNRGIAIIHEKGDNNIYYVHAILNNNSLTIESDRVKYIIEDSHIKGLATEEEISVMNEALKSKGLMFDNNDKVILAYKCKKQTEYKNGDFIYAEGNIIAIIDFKTDNDIYHCHAALTNDSHLVVSEYNWSIGISADGIQGLATRRQRLNLLKYLKKNGKRWDSDKLSIKHYLHKLSKINPEIKRAGNGGMYYYVGDICGHYDVIYTFDSNSKIDNSNYAKGNYFIDSEEAQRYAREMERLFKERPL